MLTPGWGECKPIVEQGVNLIWTNTPKAFANLCPEFEDENPGLKLANAFGLIPFTSACVLLLGDGGLPS